MRTSETHPLRIDAVDGGSGCGKIGITFAPGKRDPRAMTGGWERDLRLDLEAIVKWRAVTFVTLIESHEFTLLGIPDLGAEVRRRGLEWLHLPIQDVSAPGRKFEADWPAHSERLRATLNAGSNILVHCRGGLGRAGMVSARLLVESGVGPEEAIARVRAARPGAIETRDQEKWVKTGP
jgi:ADP-ribosyl-[dinitrogen reductase] hydrolase